MNSNQIREAFLHFFEDKQHQVIPSSSLVPHGDPTLLLTTAGMVPIKPYFMGLATPPNNRLASCQKCFRTTDIDSVGDAKHLTFFEMLGNFSVGDYFKKEAIAWAWEFVTKRLRLPADKLWVTIYLDDDEAFGCWRGLGFPVDRILRFGEKDNFWGPAGDSGPCGPCSEIHYDFGEEFGCGQPDCKPNCDCSRFSEVWNLVFTQYNQDRNGKRMPLPKPNIDTGMGLERITAAVSGMPSVYDTDLFKQLIAEVTNLTGKRCGNDETTDRAIKIVAEHSRGVAFLISDGVLPSNEGRGYVLRRILRRACFFGRTLGMDKPFMNQIVEVVVNKMGRIYTELLSNSELIGETVRFEEEKFIDTLDVGTNLAMKAIDETIRQGNDRLLGKEVFRLHDTYGFPADLTAEIARKRGINIDLEGFESEMEKQRERARAAQKFSMNLSTDIGVASALGSEFVGYEELKSISTITRIIDQDSDKPIEVVDEGKKVSIVLDKTPFYGEMGGQVGDKGKLVSCAGNNEVNVFNTLVNGSGTIMLCGEIARGRISVGDQVEAVVDKERRLDIARNHTATHLLQSALRQVLGSHVCQRGSLVSPERLRFDFSHPSAINAQQIDEIQHIVNENIRRNLPVICEDMIPYRKAIDNGAIALFDEKYGEEVRVVKVGNPAISAELCGGTHVRSTGELAIFRVVSESSIGTGLRRIEAVTGRGAESLFDERLRTLDTIANEVRSSPVNVFQKVKSLVAELAVERKRSDTLEKELSLVRVEALLAKAEKVNGITVLAASVPSVSAPVLREIGDLLRDRLKSGVIVLGTVHDDKPSFVSVVTADLLSRGLHAGDIVKQVAGITGGSGGGKPEMAQAGGKYKNKIDEALKFVRILVQQVG